MNSYTLQKLTAFTNNPNGGNPAGVWIGDNLPTPAEMQEIAAQVGFSETSFVTPSTGSNRTVRFYSPEAEVPFCGHATVATGVALGQKTGEGTYIFSTTVGDIPVEVTSHNGEIKAALTSILPKHKKVPDALLTEALSILDWSKHELDASIQPALAFAGNWHLVIAVASKKRLDDLNYDFDKLKSLMLKTDLTTLQLIWRENDELIHSRNPFPIGGIVEDSATGAAAVALGGYLREAKLVEAPKEIKIIQGEIMGSPSQLDLSIPVTGGIKVSGTAVSLEG
jgi:PhzF family phenazine biosynthesis protein